MQWTQLWKVLFGYALNSQYAENIEEWLTKEFGRGTDWGWTGDELKVALETYAETTRKAGYKTRPPTAPEIKTQIIRGRWKRGYKEDINPNEEVCGLCNNIGLMKVYPEAIDPPWTMERLAHEYQRTTPCQCKAGKKIQRFQSFETAVFNLAKQQNIALLSHIR